MSTTRAITLWSAERDVTTTRGLGDEEETLYPSRDACLDGMYQRALAIVALDPGAFRSIVNHGYRGVFCVRHRGYASHGPLPPDPATVYGYELRYTDPVVDRRPDYVEVRADIWVRYVTPREREGVTEWQRMYWARDRPWARERNGRGNAMGDPAYSCTRLVAQSIELRMADLVGIARLLEQS